MISNIILYIDSTIIVVNKPHGLLTIQDGYDKKKENLHSSLKNEYPEIMTVHRLDKETSGVIIFARNENAHRDLNSQFENRLVKKKYWAICHNIPEWTEYLAQFPLKVNGDRNHRTIINSSGKFSETLFIKHQSNFSKQLSLLEAIPHTGYTHQIRSHLSFLGFSILGDRLYFKGLSDQQRLKNKSVNRMMLHAYFLEFTHPENNEKLSFFTENPFILGN